VGITSASHADGDIALHVPKWYNLGVGAPDDPHAKIAD